MVEPFTLRIVDEPKEEPLIVTEPNDYEPLPGEQKIPNAATRKGVKKQQLLKEAREREENDFWRRVLAEKVGRRMIWEHLADLKAFELPFQYTGMGFPDEKAMLYMAGQIAAGQRLYQKLLRIDREGVYKMQDELDSKSPNRLTDG
jgi:hypothetical protein